MVGEAGPSVAGHEKVYSVIMWEGGREARDQQV